MEESTTTEFKVVNVSKNYRIIVGGKKLAKHNALRIAFPKARKIESYGFTIRGNDLQVRKYNFSNF